MKDYTHNPTEVRAIQVGRPFAAVQRAVPYARQVKSGNGRFEYFVVTLKPGVVATERAYEGDWIIRHPTGRYEVLRDTDFQHYYIPPEVSGDAAADTAGLNPVE